jgi:hypothetical protein
VCGGGKRGIVSMAMSIDPSQKHRLHDFALLFRVKFASLGPMSKKKYSLAMLVDEADLALHAFPDLRLVKETAFRPVHGKASQGSIHANIGITGQRSFLRQKPFSDLVVRVTPYSSEEMAISNVLRANDSIVHDPTRKVDIPNAVDMEGIEIEGLENVFAHQESLVAGDVKYDVLFVFSNVGQVLFSIQVSSRGDFWSWEDAASIAMIQAEKIRQNMSVLENMF